MARTWPSLGFDAFSTAVGLGIIVGALSVLRPILASLTVTLAALAIAAWALARRDTRRGNRHALGRHGALAGSAAAVGGILFFAPLPFVEPFHGLLLSFSLLPLWILERPREMRGESLRRNV